MEWTNRPGCTHITSLKNNMIFTVATVLAVVIIFATYTYGNLRKIEENWSSYRCNPVYMFTPLFVDVGTDISTNFKSCMNLAGEGIVSGMTNALGSQMSLIADALGNIANPLSLFRAMINNMRQFIMSFTSSTLGKASGPVSMFVYYLNKIQDLIRRMVGEGYIATFLGVTAVSFMEAFVSLLLTIIKGFIRAMLIIAVVLSLFNMPLLAIVLTIASSLVAAGA